MVYQLFYTGRVNTLDPVPKNGKKTGSFSLVNTIETKNAKKLAVLIHIFARLVWIFVAPTYLTPYLLLNLHGKS